MSAAQALSSALPSSASGVRSSSAGEATERGGASFRDALETETRSGDGAERGRVSPEGARGRKGAGNGTSDDEGDASGARGDEGVARPGDAAGVAELSAMLARLGGARAAEDRVTDAATLLRAASAGAGADRAAGEAGPWLPGQVTEDGDALGAEQIRALMSSGATAQPPAEQEAISVKAKITRQETHLALARGPSDALSALAGGGTTDAAPGAVQVQAMEDSLGPVRPPGTAGEAHVPGRDARSVGESWGDAALAEQGAAGGEGRGTDGRGSSGTGGQQQGSAAFMAMLAGAASQGANGVSESLDAGFEHDPVGDQIGAGVRAALTSDAAGDASQDGVVKVLQLELKPANLGSVTVRLALKGNAISIHIEAQRLDTLAVIEREREALVGALASAGYTVDGVTAAPQSDPLRSALSVAGSGDAGPGGSHGGLEGQPGQGQGLDSSSGGQGRPGETGSGSGGYRSPSDDKDAGSPGIRRDAGGLYV